MLEFSITRDYKTIYIYNHKKGNKSRFNSLLLLPTMLPSLEKKIVDESINPTPIIEKTTEVVEQVQEIDKGVLATIAEFCETVTKLVKDTIWCFQHPIHVIVIIMDWIAPLMFAFATIVPIIGLTCLVCKTTKFGFWSTKELIVNPFIVYIIYLLITLALKSLI